MTAGLLLLDTRGHRMIGLACCGKTVVLPNFKVAVHEG